MVFDTGIPSVVVSAICFVVCLLFALLGLVLYQLSTVLQQQQQMNNRTLLAEIGDLRSQVCQMRQQVAALETLAACWPCRVDSEQWLFAARQAGFALAQQQRAA